MVTHIDRLRLVLVLNFKVIKLNAFSNYMCVYTISVYIICNNAIKQYTYKYTKCTYTVIPFWAILEWKKG